MENGVHFGRYSKKYPFEILHAKKATHGWKEIIPAFLDKRRSRSRTFSGAFRWQSAVKERTDANGNEMKPSSRQHHVRRLQSDVVLFNFALLFCADQ